MRGLVLRSWQACSEKLAKGCQHVSETESNTKHGATKPLGFSHTHWQGDYNLVRKTDDYENL